MMFGNDAIVKPASREYWENKLKRDKEEMLKKTNAIQKKGCSDMGKNLIPIIANELGVEIGEEFKLKLLNGTMWRNADSKILVFRFTKNHLEYRLENSESWVDAPASVLGTIVTDDSEAIKLPFEPKCGEEYWTYDGYNEHPWVICKETWDDSAWDYIYKYAGCIFRTQKEALEALPVKYKELTGKERAE